MAKAIDNEVPSLFSAINGGVIDISEKQILITIPFGARNQATHKLRFIAPGL